MLTSILVLLAIAYIVLKVINTRAEFRRRDAEREAEESAAAAAAEEKLEEEQEEAEMRRNAVDVDPEVVEDTEE